MSYFIDGIEFKNPILNASGCWCKTNVQIKKLYESSLGGVVLKTCTLEKKDGNPIINYYHDKRSDIKFNCKGLPNDGYNYYKNMVNEYDNKPIILSVTTINYEELKIMLTDYNKTVKKKVLVEINMSCPNMENRISGYHCKDILELIYFLRGMKTRNLVYGIKMPPIFEIEKIEKISEILINGEDIIKFIVCCNSIPNGYITDKSKPILSNMYGGMSGKIGKYIGLGNVRSYYNKLRDKIVIIGCGGITDKEDIRDYMSEGARFVQLGSGFYDDYWNELDTGYMDMVIRQYMGLNIGRIQDEHGMSQG
jgi:dihydroorotate dehydrogenase (fumarate)